MCKSLRKCSRILDRYYYIFTYKFHFGSEFAGKALFNSIQVQNVTSESKLFKNAKSKPARNFWSHRNFFKYPNRIILLSLLHFSMKVLMDMQNLLLKSLDSEIKFCTFFELKWTFSVILIISWIWALYGARDIMGRATEQLARGVGSPLRGF